MKCLHINELSIINSYDDLRSPTTKGYRTVIETESNVVTNEITMLLGCLCLYLEVYLLTKENI